jgi:hypothetical protein
MEMAYNERIMKKKLYFVDRYVRCGAVPLYLIFYRTRQGQRSHFVMLCTLKKLRVLLSERKGFTDPAAYGQVIFKSHDSEPSDLLKYIIKSRYDFDLDQVTGTENRLF